MWVSTSRACWIAETGATMQDTDPGVAHVLNTRLVKRKVEAVRTAVRLARPARRFGKRRTMMSWRMIMKSWNETIHQA